MNALEIAALQADQVKLNYWTQVSHLVMVLWLLLIPLGLMVVALLVRLLLMLHTVSEFMSVARFELYPILKDTRELTQRTNRLSAQAEQGVQALQAGVASVSSRITAGVEKASALNKANSGLSVNPLRRAGRWAKAFWTVMTSR